MIEIGQRLASILAEIDDHSRRAERAPPTLIAVSKRHPPEAIRAAYEAGQRDFGESYAQEFIRKSEALRDLDALRWHIIGPLQRNKAKHIAPLSPRIHTLSSTRLMDALNRHALKPVDTLIQVNLAGETQKSGVSPEDVGALIEHARSACPQINIRGLMLIPPRVGDPSPWYARLRDLASEHHLTELSMGMSDDFHLAIQEGATMVRVGTRIFGPRP